jgi:tRNA (guanine37-N1)-methyltransferase
MLSPSELAAVYGRRVAAAVCGDPDVAADAMQEAFIRAFDALATCRRPDRFGAWFFQILRNQCLNHRTRRRRHEPLESVQAAGPAAGRTVLLTPGGRPLDQSVVEELSRLDRIVLVCGRYEGFDARIRETLAADEISIGDYVLSGGEVAAMVIVDAVARLLPGVLGDEESARQDSFSGAERLVEGPQYTRPREFRGLRVPDVLLSGDHGRIATWRHEQAVAATQRRFPSVPSADPFPRSLP